MTSLRKLRRRALRWKRYEDRVYGPGLGITHRGRERAVDAMLAERYRWSR